MPRARRPLTAVATALAGVTAMALTTGAASPATADGPGRTAAARTADEPSLTGTGKLARKPGDDVHFTFDAHGFLDKAHGTFQVSHRYGPKWSAAFKGRVDCLVTGGPVAVATGVVTESHVTDAPGMPRIGDLKGKRFGFTVLDQGRKDRLGYSWALDGLPRNSVPKCVGSAPFETLAKGDYKVHHWMPRR
ncbi:MULTISPECIES: hypothetical protein [Streptomyces]|uniref:hypothetical protein n=1 Tax=Streptomyces TaxID=1883 RepID=UPI00163C0789|nr:MULTISPECIES: hypothetical protein [Streptomyces]MBC2876249.1 hypothetical protein [Streptomyces sp. TYQ1024]UBI35527.1 hypothetical protein K7I03_02950 [Streptomyces mobaraensis]UKW28120.1 hypothetical protein MCU78_02980 [Streptomyces sp. TYQ1024]